MNTYYVLDKWGEGFRNCVSYTAWQSNQQFNINTTNWGNGADWYNSATAAGYTEDLTPQVGDIAQWDALDSNRYGHVAYVYAVTNGVASYAEYNYARDGSYLDTYTSTSQGAPTHWIHLGTPTPPPPNAFTGVGGAEFHGDTMTSGMTLYTNQYLTSQNVMYALVFQTDSNLALYSAVTTPLWRPNNNQGTAGSNANCLVMQTDGNLVMYRSDNSVVWNSETGNHPGAWARLQSDGNFVVYTTTGAAIWASGTGGHANLTFVNTLLNPGQQINSGEYLRSPDGRYVVVMQAADGNVVEYGPGAHVIWATGANGGGNRLVMQTDGNLVKYAGTIANWNSQTTGANNTANLQSDGNFVVRLANGTAIWTRDNWLTGPTI